MIDTHTHLYLPQFEGEESAAVDRALEAGVGKMIFPGVSVETIEPMHALAAKYPGQVYMAQGLHPSEVGEHWRDDLEIIKSLYDSHKYVAVGEVGIDLYWEKQWADAQMQAFESQIALAAERNLPVIIHCRDGLDETLEVLKGFGSSERPNLVFHSFTMGTKEADRIRTELDEVMFGINGVVTFKNAPELRDAVAAIGLQNLLLETDSPYLAPVPHRGKRNESSYLGAVRDKIAEVLRMPASEVEAATDANATRYFNL